MCNDDSNTGVTSERKPQVSHLMTVSIVLGVVDEILLRVLPDYDMAPFWLVIVLLLLGPVVGIAAIARISSSEGRIRGPMSVGAFLVVWMLLVAMLFFVFLRVNYAHPPPPSESTSPAFRSIAPQSCLSALWGNAVTPLGGTPGRLL